MKKTLLALALFSTCLCACNERKISESVSGLSSTNISNDASSIQHASSSSEEYERPDDWYSPRYYDDYKEPRDYERLLEFNYQDEEDQKRLFDYLATIEDGKYVSKFPVPLNSSLEPDPNAVYTSYYYNCCKEEYTRIPLNFVFEIDEPYYKYGMEMDGMELTYAILKFIPTAHLMSFWKNTIRCTQTKNLLLNKSKVMLEVAIGKPLAIGKAILFLTKNIKTVKSLI